MKNNAQSQALPQDGNAIKSRVVVQPGQSDKAKG